MGMEGGDCLLCLKKGVNPTRSIGRPPVFTSRREQVHIPINVHSLCQLLSTGTEKGQGGEEEEEEDVGGGVGLCVLCSKCWELTHEMRTIRRQITQLQEQFGKRRVLVRNRIRGSKDKARHSLTHPHPGGDKEEEATRGTRIRELLLRLSHPGEEGEVEAVPEEDLISTEEVEVKIEKENEDFDDKFEDEGPLSPSTFLLYPQNEEEVLSFKEEEEEEEEETGGDEAILKIKTQQKKQGKSTKEGRPFVQQPGLRRSTRRLPTGEQEENDAKPQTKRRMPTKNKRFSHPSRSQPKVKSKTKPKIRTPPPKRETPKKHSDTDFDPSKNSESDTSEESLDKETDHFEEDGRMPKKSPNPFKCDHCLMRFRSDDALSRHIQQRHAHQCTICQKRFRLQHVMEAHYRTEHKGAAPYQCPICQKKFRRKERLAQHLVIRHETGDKSFHCDSCQKGFSLEVNFQRHVSLHDVEGRLPFICDICDSRYADKERLQRHVATHDQPITCPVCFKVSANSTTFARHRLIHTGEKPVSCDQCEERFIDHMSRRLHKAKFHSTPDDHHLCPICGKRFLTASALKTHTDRHERKIKVSCDHCGQGFMDHGTLRSHKISKHGEDPLICDECGAKFRYSSALRIHQKSQHSGLKPFVCEICGKRFALKSVFDNHKATHTGIRPFPCPHCEARFKTKKNLQSHVKKIHTTYVLANPATCTHPGCGKQFEYKSGLVAHVRQVHSTERPFVCDLCNRGFAAHNTLNLHKRTVHGESPSVPEGGRLPKSKRQFPWKTDASSSGRRRKIIKVGGPNGESGSSSSGDNSNTTNSEPPPPDPQFPPSTQFTPGGGGGGGRVMNLSGSTTSSFYNQSFHNYLQL